MCTFAYVPFTLDGKYSLCDSRGSAAVQHAVRGPQACAARRELAERNGTLQVATSAWKYASAAATTASTVDCEEALGAAAASRAALDSARHASCRFTAVGRLQT